MRDSQLVAATGLQPQLVAAHSQEFDPEEEEEEVLKSPNVGQLKSPMWGGQRRDGVGSKGRRA